MATKLTKPVRRETAKIIQTRPIIVTVAPSKDEALIGLRLKGTREQLVAPVSALYATMSLWRANAVRSAKAKARKAGVPWKQAKKKFIAENTI